MTQEVLLDTNVFIRYFIEDNKEQVEKSKKIFKKIYDGDLTARVSILVVNEIIWILGQYYSIRRIHYIPKLIHLLSLQKITILEVKKDLLIEILLHFQITSFDFTDIYLFHIAGGNDIFSFDRDFKKLS